MATFAKSLDSKLKALETTQTGIQTLSLWIIHHRHHANAITEAWVDRVKKVVRSEKRLGLFYLANDVVQNGRKKAKELIVAFGKAFLEVIPLYSDEKTKPQVERVFNIWVERSVYDTDFIAKLRLALANSTYKPPAKAVEDESKITKTKKVKEEKPDEKKTPVKPRRTVPPDFKVANLLVSIKKTTSLDSEVTRKSKKLDNLKIDASSYDSVKHVKDRSSVGKFHKQFEESKSILDDYIRTLRRAEKDKSALMSLLNGGESFYSLAQDEAKVIVNAYKTFGNRLHSMKRKLDVKIKKLEEDQNEGADQQRGTANIEDMDLADSDDEDTTTEKNTVLGNIMSQQRQNKTQQQAPAFISQSNFFNPLTMNGMTSFMQSTGTETSEVATLLTPVSNIERTQSVTTPLSDISVDTPEDRLQIADDPFMSGGFMPGPTTTIAPDTTAVFGMVNGNTISSSSDSGIPNVTTTGSFNGEEIQKHDAIGADKNPNPVQNLIDSLFPVLSKSLQTIKEKTQGSVSEEPSVNAAMAFALGDESDGEAVKKKQKFEEETLISPVSLTNPKGLSEHQEELISIAAGLTEFDENFLPVSNSSSTACSRSQSHEEEKLKNDESIINEKRRDESSKRSSGKHRHRSHRDEKHRRSNSRSPQRRSSHRSSKDSRDDRRSERRKSRRSSSPRIRKRGSRGHRSSSKEHDERRKRSPDSERDVYYNDRRSPTPEMDSSAGNFQQQPPSQPPINPTQAQPIMPGQPSQQITILPSQQFPPSSSSVASTGEIMNQPQLNDQQQSQTLVDSQTFLNQQQPTQQQQGLVITTPSVYPTSDPFPQQQQNDQQHRLHNSKPHEQEEKSDDKLQTLQTAFPPIMTPQGMMPPPPQMLNIRPTRSTLRPNNPLQLLPQQADELLDPSIGPNIIPPFNTQPQFRPMPPNQSFPPQTTETIGHENSDEKEQQQQSFFDPNNPPPFPGAPPIPPPFMRPPFTPTFRPEFLDTENTHQPIFPPEQIPIRPPLEMGDNHVRPGFFPEKFRPMNPPMDDREKLHFQSEPDFIHKPDFHQNFNAHQQEPHFRPNFHSPSRLTFRPRGPLRQRFLRPRHPMV